LADLMLRKLDDEMVRNLRIIAAVKGKRIRDLVEGIFRDYLLRHGAIEVKK
jgi:plasmid stability protein